LTMVYKLSTLNIEGYRCDSTLTLDQLKHLR
jgi:hypothetical protein